MRVLLVGGPFPALSETFIVAHFTGLLERGVDAHYWGSSGNAAAWAAYPGSPRRFAAASTCTRRARGRCGQHARRSRAASTAACSTRLAARRPASRRDGCWPARRSPASSRTSSTSSSGSARWHDLDGRRGRVPARRLDARLRRQLAGLDQPGYFDEVWDASTRCTASARTCGSGPCAGRAARRRCRTGSSHRPSTSPASVRQPPSRPSATARWSCSRSRGCTGRRATSTGCWRFAS